VNINIEQYRSVMSEIIEYSQIFKSLARCFKIPDRTKRIFITYQIIWNSINLFI